MPRFAIASRLAPLLLLVCLAILLPSPVYTAGSWSEPENISAGIAATPAQGLGAVITGDLFGGVHAAWPECSTQGDACAADTIYYAALREGKWTPPVDIMAAASGEAVVTQVLTTDRFGRLILVWMGMRGLNFSIAEPEVAGSARGWSTTTFAASESVRTADLVVDEASVYNLVYIANDRRIEYIRSVDAGATWTNPVSIYVEDRPDAAATAPKIAATPDGSVSVCWTTTEEAAGWGAVGVQLAASDNGGASWVSMQPLAEGRGLGSCALLADKEGRLHAFWLGGLTVGGRYHRMSTDHGETWTAAQTVAPPDEIAGFPGAPRLLEDSEGTVHAIFAGLGPAGEQIWHAQWRDDMWTRPAPLSGPLPHNEKPAAALVDGKHLHVAWLEYDSLDFWHAVSDTGAPAVRVDALPLPTALPPGAQPVSTAMTPMPTVPSPAPDAPLTPAVAAPSGAPATASDGLLLVISLAPAVLLVGGVLVARIIRKR